ncbi:MAG: DinB family protein [Acidimicrobiales bacterium]
MTRRLLTVEQVLRVLPTTGPRIAELTAGLSPTQLRAGPEPGEWSANEVLAHMRACSDMWGGCISRIVAEDHPSIRAVNPTTWIGQTDYVDQDFASSLRAFEAQRVDLLAVVPPLGSDHWSRAATITGGGRPREQTVLDYASRLAGHERTHLKQVEAVVREVRTRPLVAGPHDCGRLVIKRRPPPSTVGPANR